MMSLQLEDICRTVQGKWVGDPIDGVVQEVSTDSRTINREDLFVALEGEHHDGHDFVDEARKKGARAAIVSHVPNMDEQDEQFGLIKVEDTLDALGNLADFYRGIINATVVAVTGSSGKTTTKDAIAHLLRQEYNVVKAPESYNNHVGVPLSLFQVDPVHDYVVLEIGTNHPGEIAALSRIARPDIGVLTSISEVHLKGLGSLEGIKREKGDLFRYLTGDGFSVYNADNQHVVDVMEGLGISGYSYAIYNEANMTASDIQSTLNGVRFLLNGALEVELPVLGAWNVYNLLAGFTIAKQTGVDLVEAAESLQDFQPPSMRMEKTRVGEVTVINDAYNSDPRSVQLVLDELDHYEWEGRKVAVLGDMAELGERSEEFHREIGRSLLRKSQIDHVYFVGKDMSFAADEVRSESREFSVHTFKTTEEACNRITDEIKAGDLLLLKGSRIMELERIIDAIEQTRSTVSAQT